MANECLVFGEAGAGKTHLIEVLRDPETAPPSVQLTTRYYSAAVALVEECASPQGWVAVCRPTREGFGAVKAAVAARVAAGECPTLRLLVINEAAAADAGLAARLSCDAGVIDWCLDNSFEAVPRAFSPEPVLFDRAAVLRRGLLTEDLVGTPRVYQALGSTMWTHGSRATPRGEVATMPQRKPPPVDPLRPPADLPSNLCVFVWGGGDCPPRDAELTEIGAERVGDTWQVPLRTKYYRAEVRVVGCDAGDASELGRLLRHTHAVIAWYRSDRGYESVTRAVSAARDGREVEVALLARACDATSSVKRTEAWGWAVEEQFEYVCCEATPSPGAASASAPLAAARDDSDDEPEGYQRCREALAATMWPQSERPGTARAAAHTDPTPRDVAPAAEGCGDTARAAPAAEGGADTVRAAPAGGADDDSAAREEEEDRRGRQRRVVNRGASGIPNAQGCELPPGWVFDTVRERSRELSPLRRREGDIDGDGDDPTGFDRMYQEAMFLRKHGGSLDPDERRERAAQIAMSMFGTVDDDDKAGP